MKTFVDASKLSLLQPLIAYIPNESQTYIPPL